MHSVPHNVINEPITIPPQSQPVILSPKMMSKAELLKIKWEKEKGKCVVVFIDRIYIMLL